MKKATMLHCLLLRFLLPLFLLVTFSFSFSSADQVFPGNDVNSIGNEDLTRTTLKNINHDEEEKFKFIPHHKPFFKKPVFKIPPKVVVPLKPFPAVGKPIPVNDEKPLPIPGFKKPFPKPFPFVKKPFPKPFIPKPIPFVEKPFPKPLPKPIPFEKKPFLKPFVPVDDEKPLPIPGLKKPFPKPFPFVKKPIPKPFIIPKPIPFVKKPFPKPFLKPIPFEKKPFPKPFIPKPIPVDDEKPLPIPGFEKPFPKPFIPKPIPLVKKPFPKPLSKPIPFVKKPFPSP